MNEAVVLMRTVTFDLPAERLAGLEEIASERGVSLSDLLQAGVSAVLLFHALDESETTIPLILEYEDFSFHPMSLAMLLSVIDAEYREQPGAPIAPDRSQGMAQ